MTGFKRSAKTMTSANEAANVKKIKEVNKKEHKEPLEEVTKKPVVVDNSQEDDFEVPPSEAKRPKFNFFAYKQKISAPARDPCAFEVPSGNENSLEGLTFVFTGDLVALSRDEAIDLVKRLGGRVTTAPSSKTSYVVVGEDAGPKKLEKIKELHIKTFTEEEFYEFVRKMPAKAEASSKLSEIISTGQLPLSPKKKSHFTPIEVKKTNILKSILPEEIVEPISNEEDLLLTEKYAPKRVQDIIGNQTNISRLTTWLQSWTIESKGGKDNFRAALLSGPPGIGKTTTAKLVSKSLGLIPIELNASDSRSKSSLEDHVRELLGNRGCDEFFDPKFYANPKNKVNHVLIMDEVDGMSAGDRGGMAYLISLIKKTKIPIICVCNDRSSTKIRSLANHCLDLRFRKMESRHLAEKMGEIAAKEGLDIKPNAMEQLVSTCNSDIRHILNLFSLLKLHPQSDAPLNYDQAKKLNFETKKDTELGLFDVISELFSSHARSSISGKLDNYFVDPSIIPLMMQENYLHARPALHAKSPQGMSIDDSLKNYMYASDVFSSSDLVDTVTQRYQEYSLAPFHGFLTTILPIYYVGGGLHSRIDFTSWLGQNSKQIKNVRVLREIKTHISLCSLISRKQLRLLQMPIMSRYIIQLVAEGHVEKAVNFLDDYNLLKEDFDAMLEICLGSLHSTTAYSKVPTATKTSFTRLYNKLPHQLPYPIGVSLAAPITKEFGAVEENVDDALLDDIEPLDDSGVDGDKMIKQKVSKKSKK